MNPVPATDTSATAALLDPARRLWLVASVDTPDQPCSRLEVALCDRCGTLTVPGIGHRCHRHRGPK